ncbi:hypothetical protein GCM10010080_12740 [Thermomonas carbonis]|nr:hypothetical protein GCM10010080_12740 [Thermomonas carbonis]
MLQGLLLLAIAQWVETVNIPLTSFRFGAAVVGAAGLLVTGLAIAAWKMRNDFALVLNSTVLTMIIAFSAGYHPVHAGDLTVVNGRMVSWQSETEWTEINVRGDPLFGWSNKPNTVSRQSHQDFKVSYAIDGEGWRRLPARPAGSPEIWFLGCSFTFGVGVDDQQAYPALLAQKAWPTAQVRNFSVSGWGTTQAYLVLKNLLTEKTKPRAILYGWINHHRQRNYLRASWFSKSKARQIPRFEVESGELSWVGMVPGSQAKMPEGPELDKKEVAVTIALVRAMAALTREHGVPFIIVLLDPTDPEIKAAFTAIPGVKLMDVGGLSTAFHPNEGHPAPLWHQVVAHAIAADPLLSNLTGMPELLAPSAIADPPMREWHSSWDRSLGAGKLFIRYPAQPTDTLKVEFVGPPAREVRSSVVRHGDIRATKGRTYAFEMVARASGQRPLTFALDRATAPFDNLGLRGDIQLTPEWQRVRRYFVATGDDTAAALALSVGASTESIEFATAPLLRELAGDELAAAAASLAQPQWKLSAEHPSQASLEHVSPVPQTPFLVRVQASGEDIWEIQLQLDGIALEAGREYTFALRARAARARPLEYAITLDRPSWENLGLWGRTELGPGWQEVRRDFIATADETHARMTLAIGSSEVPVEIGEVRLLAGGRDLLQTK